MSFLGSAICQTWVAHGGRAEGLSAIVDQRVRGQTALGRGDRKQGVIDYFRLDFLCFGFLCLLIKVSLLVLLICSLCYSRILASEA